MDIKVGSIVKYIDADNVLEVTDIRRARPCEEMEGMVVCVRNSKRNFAFLGKRCDEPIPMTGVALIRMVVPMYCKHCKERRWCFKNGLFHRNKPACKDFLCDYDKV